MASVYRVANDRVRLLVFADDGTWLSLLYDGALGGFASFERSAPGRQFLVLDRDERADRGVGPDLGGGGEWQLAAAEALRRAK